MTIENVNVKMFRCTIEQEHYPNGYLMKEEDWKNNLADADACYFKPLLDKYRKYFDWEKLEPGGFYYSRWHNPNILFFRDDVLWQFKINKYYCLPSSFFNLSSYVDPFPYKSTDEYNKAIHSLQTIINVLAYKNSFIGFSL